jgi:aspartyl-tRNA(Asn)/glutamyl-tRNA(Gln) amidotransferase subunit C
MQKTGRPDTTYNDFLLFFHEEDEGNKIRYFCFHTPDMEVNDALIGQLARLSQLEFDDARKDEFKKDLQKMIGFVEKLKHLDVSGVEPLLYMGEEPETLREDIKQPSLDRQLALAIAPDADDQYFKVPQVVK